MDTLLEVLRALSALCNVLRFVGTVCGKAIEKVRAIRRSSSSHKKSH